MRETRLMVLYLGGVVTSMVSTICMAVVWLYWQRTLDTCPEKDCGCVLGGKWTFSTFLGGSGHICRFLTIGPLPILFWSVLMACIHGYRVCRPKKKKQVVRIADVRSSAKEVEVSRHPLTYLFLGMLDIIISIIALSCCVVMTDGFQKTCSQYKKSVISQMNASGNMAELVLNRLSCSSVYDFMDYLQPDPTWLDYKYRRGSWLIYTGASLVLALVTIWINFILYVLLSVYNCILFFKERRRKGMLFVPPPQSNTETCKLRKFRKK